MQDGESSARGLALVGWGLLAGYVATHRINASISIVYIISKKFIVKRLSKLFL